MFIYLVIIFFLNCRNELGILINNKLLFRNETILINVKLRL